MSFAKPTSHAIDPPDGALWQSTWENSAAAMCNFKYSAAVGSQPQRICRGMEKVSDAGCHRGKESFANTSMEPDSLLCQNDQDNTGQDQDSRRQSSSKVDFLEKHSSTNDRQQQ